MRRADVCAVAIAEAFRGDGEILASPMGTLPSIGARLARLTFEPDLLLTDGEAFLLGDVPPLGVPARKSVVEGWIPYRQVFDVVASGRRHVMMGASQIDPTGNTEHLLHRRPGPPEVAAARCPRSAGQHRQPPDQLLDPQALDAGLRPAGRHGLRRRLRAGGRGRSRAARYHRLGRVITDLAVLDFGD